MGDSCTLAYFIRFGRWCRLGVLQDNKNGWTTLPSDLVILAARADGVLGESVLQSRGGFMEIYLLSERCARKFVSRLSSLLCSVLLAAALLLMALATSSAQ